MDSNSIENRLKDLQISDKQARRNVKNVKKSIDQLPKILGSRIRNTFHKFARLLDIKSFKTLAVKSKEINKNDSVENVEASIDEGSKEISKNDNVENVEASIEEVFASTDNVENVEASIDEDPKILSSEIRDVFHIFASMLDVKSFMKLAVTSKEMYERCMENSQISISVDVSKLAFSDSSLQYSYEIPIDALRKLPCNVQFNTRCLTILPLSEQNELSIESVRNWKKTGLNKVHKLELHHVKEWDTVFAIVKEFDVKSLILRHRVETDILRSVLQLNLQELKYEWSVSADLILEVDSPIQKICFPELQNISKDKLMDIMSKIQSGSLCHLIVNKSAIDWKDYTRLSFDNKGPLPDHRALLLSRIRKSEDPEYWFLHSHGGLTKCVPVKETLEMYKCEPWEYPYILRKEEDILKDLLQKRPIVSCSADQFRSFSKSLTMIDYSHKGPLPHDRPLYFKGSQMHFWILDEEENLMICTWENGIATNAPFKHYDEASIEHPALVKYMFWKLLKRMEGSDGFRFYCGGTTEFDSWFEDFEILDFEYSGPLPSRRPLVFRRDSPENEEDRFRIVLLDDDRLVQCYFSGRTRTIVQPCHYSSCPPILFTPKYVMDMLKDRPGMDLKISFDVFHEGLEMFKKSPMVLRKHLLIFEKTETEFWCSRKAEVRKVVWKDGLLSTSKEIDLRETPPFFMTQVFRNYAENGWGGYLTLRLEQFRSCLEEFTIVPFDYSGPMTSDSPLAFVKKGRTSVFVWFLWNGVRATKCSWGQEDKVLFGDETGGFRVPPFLKSKKFLKILLEAKYSDSSRFDWFGDFEELLHCLKDYVKLPRNHDGPLPEERPLLFDYYSHSRGRNMFILREDSTVIKCVSSGAASLSLSLSSDVVVRCALLNAL